MFKKLLVLSVSILGHLPNPALAQNYQGGLIHRFMQNTSGGCKVVIDPEKAYFQLYVGGVNVRDYHINFQDGHLEADLARYVTDGTCTIPTGPEGVFPGPGEYNTIRVVGQEPIPLLTGLTREQRLTLAAQEAEAKARVFFQCKTYPVNCLNFRSVRIEPRILTQRWTTGSELCRGRGAGHGRYFSGPCGVEMTYTVAPPNAPITFLVEGYLGFQFCALAFVGKVTDQGTPAFETSKAQAIQVIKEESWADIQKQLIDQGVCGNLKPSVSQFLEITGYDAWNPPGFRSYSLPSLEEDCASTNPFRLNACRTVTPLLRDPSNGNDLYDPVFEKYLQIVEHYNYVATCSP